MEQPGSEFSDGPHDLQEEAGSNTRRHGATARGWRAAGCLDRSKLHPAVAKQPERGCGIVSHVSLL